MCKANGSHPAGSCLSQSLGTGDHSGAGGDDIVYQQDALACDLLFIQNAIDALQIGAPLCCAQGVLGGGSGSLFQKLLAGQMQLSGKLLGNQLCLIIPAFALALFVHGDPAQQIRLGVQQSRTEALRHQDGKDARQLRLILEFEPMHRPCSLMRVIGKGKAGIQPIQKEGGMVTGKAVFAAGTAAALGRDNLSAEGTAGGPEEMQQLPQWYQSGHGSHRLCL